MLPPILKCEQETVRQTLASLERDSGKFKLSCCSLNYASVNLVCSPLKRKLFLLGTPLGQNTLQCVLNERCDGNRNIFHAAVTTCFPTSNKDTDFGNHNFIFHMFNLNIYTL